MLGIYSWELYLLCVCVCVWYHELIPRPTSRQMFYHWVEINNQSWAFTFLRSGLKSSLMNTSMGGRGNCGWNVKWIKNLKETKTRENQEWWIGFLSESQVNLWGYWSALWECGVGSKRQRLKECCTVLIHDKTALPSSLKRQEKSTPC